MRNFTRIRPKLILKIDRISKYRQINVYKEMNGLGEGHKFQCKKSPKLQAPYLYQFTTNPHESSQFSKVDIINRPKAVF